MSKQSRNASNPILALDYPAGLIEVIVMDGGSKDATVKIAAEISQLKWFPSA